MNKSCEVCESEKKLKLKDDRTLCPKCSKLCIMHIFIIDSVNWTLVSTDSPQKLKDDNTLQYDTCYYFLNDGVLHTDSLHEHTGYFNSMTIAESSLLNDLF